MNYFANADVLSTMAGCSVIITLLTQVFKKYLPEKIDTKWLALVFSILVGILRIVYVGQYDFNGIVAGIFNIVVLLATSVGVYEMGSTAKTEIKNIIKRR